MWLNRLCPSAVVLCTVAILLSSSAVHAENGRCLRAEVPAPMVFPDGTTHPAGTLTLCVADYSPVASYHRVSVNGRPVGFLFSQRRSPEREPIAEPVVLFRRTDSGSLRLLGYLWPSGDKVVSYLLRGEPWGAKTQTRIVATETGFPAAE